MTMRIATAEWANPDEVEERYRYRDGMVWLGRSLTEDQVPLGYEDDRHISYVGGTRGSKGTTGIIPTLLTWPGSVCCIDPKGENATITAARRGRGSKHSKGMGQTVRVLDPFKAAQVDDSVRARFNPLDALDPNNEECGDEAGRIADAIVVKDLKDPFWTESARAMVKGLILHIRTDPRYEGQRNLTTLRKLIMRGDWETVETLEQLGDKHGSAPELLWMGLKENKAFDGLVAGLGDRFYNMLMNSPKMYESVLAAANNNTEFIDSPPMQRLLGASDFQLSELKTRPEGLSLYLSLPERYMNTHFRWLRMMVVLTVTEMEKVRGRPAAGHPVLLMLDEFAGLERMEVIEHAVAQIAGFGVKMFFVLQTLPQLKDVYKDNWETFLANSGLKVFFNLEDNFSREYVSKLIGETEVIREVRSASDSTSESESLSRSTSQSRSESRGRSSSTGTSENEGTNSSVSTGKSRGVNEGTSKSWGASWGRNWEAAAFWGGATTGGNDGRSITQSESHGYSHSWNKGQSHGVSHGTSRSRTDGTSDTSGTSTSETEGTTHGTSTSRTAGSSETIQKRALVTPDEIGQAFALIKDRRHPAYPGLEIALISGARPVALRRVNYYEDFQFLGLFDPHPDWPLIEPKKLKVDSGPLVKQLVQLDRLLTIGEWSIEPGQIVRAGAPALPVYNAKHDVIANVRIPRGGMIAGISDVQRGPLFSLRYYEDGAAPIDPFAELRKLCEEAIRNAEARQKQLPSKRRTTRVKVMAVGVLVALVLVVVGAQTVIRYENEKAAEQAQQDKANSEFEHRSFDPLSLRNDQPKEQTTQPAPAENAAAPAPAPDAAGSTQRSFPIMVGKIDVSQFAGLKPGDTRAQAAILYGAPVSGTDVADEIFYGSGGTLVDYRDGVVNRVALMARERDWVRSRLGNDALLDLFGHSEADVVALLGTPESRQEEDKGAYYLFWGFAMPDRPAGEHGDLSTDASDQTLALEFSPDLGCSWISVRW